MSVYRQAGTEHYEKNKTKKKKKLIDENCDTEISAS